MLTPIRAAVVGLGVTGLQLAHSLDRAIAGYTLAAAELHQQRT